MMRRIYPSAMLAAVIALGWPAIPSAVADEMTFDPVDANQEPEQEEVEIEIDPTDEPDLDSDLASTKAVKADELKLAETRVSWQDIVVVVRKPFLKTQRVETLPLVGVTMNDNIIQHVQGGGQVNYWLTDVLSVGVEGFLYAHRTREPFDLVALQARRLPTVNQYNLSAALNFHYVPIYGKFAVLDQHIVHWEMFFSTGFGVTQTEVIPRDPALQPFTNWNLTPNVGASMRFFLTRFLTVNIGVRDYVFRDKFENVNRTEVSGDVARQNASSAFINNVMFQAGIAVWVPMSFEYTTFR